MKRVLNGLERITLALERPINRLVREPLFNPLYHTGPLTVMLLILVAVTGVYLTMFYQFGFEASYEAVARIEASPIGRIVRALHRYASDLALLAALLHGYRTFFMDRFRGPRWLAWVTGVGTTVCIWAIGATGYWLPMDERAQLLTQSLVRLIGDWTPAVRYLIHNLLTEAAGSGWAFMMLVLLVHVGLSAAVAALFVLHIRRLSRPKIAPPHFWMAMIVGVSVIAAILVPVGMLAPADPQRLPGPVTLDLFYLAYLPAALQWPPLPLWGSALVLTAVVTALPWLLRRKLPQPVRILPERCTGCTLCAADCPYRAITMTRRTDDSHHKFIAVVNPRLCVSCGVCIGSCSPGAIALGDRLPAALWEAVAGRATGQPTPHAGKVVVFTCERHATHGARSYLAGSAVPGSAPTLTTEARPSVTAEEEWDQEVGDAVATKSGGHNFVVIPLTCIAMAHPDLAQQALAAGAAEVRFIGCPPEDCTNREGNVWMQQRLARRRPPKAPADLPAQAVTAHWLPPDDFARGLQARTQQAWASAYEFAVSRATGLSLLPPLVLLAAVTSFVMTLSHAPYPAYAGSRPRIEIAMTHRSGAALAGLGGAAEPATAAQPAGDVRLMLQMDGQVVFDKTYEGREEAVAFEQIEVAPGVGHLQLVVADRLGQAEPQVLLERTVTLANQQVLALRLRDARRGGDPAAGQKLFNETRGGTGTGCRICHALQPGVKLVGPSLAGIGTAAATRVPGLSAEEYLRQALLEPDAYIVEGYRAGQMPPDYLTRLSREEIEDLVAYLLTLR